jgi:hypothetical protein
MKLAEADPRHASGARSFTLRRWILDEGTFSVRLFYSGDVQPSAGPTPLTRRGILGGLAAVRGISAVKSRRLPLGRRLAHPGQPHNLSINGEHGHRLGLRPLPCGLVNPHALRRTLGNFLAHSVWLALAGSAGPVRELEDRLQPASSLVRRPDVGARP